MNEKLTNQKDNLARLMAGEDLTVVHKNIPTAYFDVKNRVLACPIFKDDISPALYDLFMGHEVGHALNTPFEGLHSALEKNRTLKGYLNVIEDVRIEKAIKAKYPGLRNQFYKAYKELVARDFFGIKGKDVNKLSLIDRINLLTKVGSTAGCEFVGEEIKFVEMAEACKTWEDVVACATAIYEWSKENETRTQEDQSVSTLPMEMPDFDDEEEGEEGEGSSMSGDEDGDEEGDDESEDSVGSSSEEGEDSLPDAPESNEEGEEGEEEGGQGDISSRKEGGTKSNVDHESYSDDSDGARESITEYNAHNNEGEFLEDSPIIRQTHTFSDGRMFGKGGEADNIVITSEELAKKFEEWYASERCSNVDKLKDMADFSAKKIVDKNKSLIAHMAKEFEMKQNAQRSVKAFQGKTGKLDMNAVAKYQVMDDIFKKVTYLPDGKNHGVIVLLDWSGSIHGSVKNLLEQSLILSEFCKKVNIPYRIFAFSDQFRTEENAYGRGESVLLELFANGKSKQTMKQMYRAFGIIYNSYLTAETRNWDKSETLVTEWFGSKLSENNYSAWDFINGGESPYFIRLGGTPLDNSLIAMRKLLPEFRSAYQLEKIILTVITDGFSHESNHMRGAHYDNPELTEQIESLEKEGVRSYDITKHQYLTDPYSRKTYPYSCPNSRYSNWDTNGWTKTSNLLDWISQETGVTVTGYFALERKQDFYGLLNAVTGLRDQIEKDMGYDDNYRKTWGQIRKEGLVVKTHGYNKLFITASASLKTVDDELSDDLIGAKKSTLLSNFKKNRSSKVGSRFLTNEFIKEIA